MSRRSIWPRLTLLLVFLFVVVMPQTSYAAEDQLVVRYGLVTADELNARSGPGIDYGVDTLLRKHMLIRYEDLGNGWGKIIQDYDLITRIRRYTKYTPAIASSRLHVSLEYIDEILPYELEPIPLEENELRFIVVDLSEQKLTAYRNSEVFLESGVSTGRPGYSTPTGIFTIQSKRFSQSMAGWNRQEGFWVVSFIPAVQYVVGDVAIHGTYWHEDFGNGLRHSHGCINVPADVALQLYRFTTPAHYPYFLEHLYGNSENPDGTVVIIKE